jgi:peptide/nickel transport system substrate-binding protein
VNGRELTADDVVYSLEDNFYEHPEAKKPVDVNKIESITAPDKYTVEIKTTTIYATALDALMVGDTVFMFPPEMDEYYGENWATVDGVCGTGPFVMTDFVSGSSGTFVRNHDYWGYDELNPQNQIPYVDSVKWLVIPDASTVLSALRTGKIDYVTAVAMDNAEALKQTNPELKWYGYPFSSTYKINIRSDQEPFSDIRVRKALNMALDREGIIEGYLKGQGTIVNYLYTPEMTDVYTPLEELPEDIGNTLSITRRRQSSSWLTPAIPMAFRLNVLQLLLTWSNYK